MHTRALRDASLSAYRYVDTWDFYDGLGRYIQSQARHAWSDTTLIAPSTTRYDNLGRVAAEIDPVFRTGTPGVFWSVDWNAVNKPHRRISYPTDVSGDPQVNAGCTTGANTRTVYYGADNIGWDSTRTTQCGLITRSWDMANDRTETVSDIRGNITSIVNAAGDTTSYAYTIKDQLETVTDPVGNTTTYTYNNQQTQPSSLDDPDLGTITYTYDLHGRLKTQTDARNVTLDVTWDKANRPTNLKRSGQDVSSWVYDPAGHAGQLASEQHWNRKLDGSAKGHVTKTHAYNNRHQLASTTWDIPALPNGTQTINYTYRDSGQPDTITYPNGAVVDYRYNRLEQQDQVTLNGAMVGRLVQYDAAGRPTLLQRGTVGTATQLDTTRTYDPNTNRLASLVTTDSAGTNVQDYSYTYTVDGLISTINDQSINNNGANVNQTSCFTYDSMGQLLKGFTRADHNCNNAGSDAQGVDPYQTFYTYNKIGAITSATGTWTLVGNYTYPAATQPRPHAPTQAGNRTYTYDAAGNRKTQTIGGTKTTYVYDVQNRLIEMTGGTVHLYDANGARVRRVIPAKPTIWYLGGTYETTGTGTNQQTIHINIAGQTIGAAINNTIWTTATDHLGSASYSTSTTGTQVQRYTPFGHIRNYTNQHNQPTDRTYTSQLNDHNGLYHYNARYYDPNLAQFTQPDTIVPSASLSTDWNRYTYVRNNPLTYTDPSGHEPFPCEGHQGTCTRTFGDTTYTMTYVPAAKDDYQVTSRPAETRKSPSTDASNYIEPLTWEDTLCVAQCQGGRAHKSSPDQAIIGLGGAGPHQAWSCAVETVRALPQATCFEAFGAADRALQEAVRWYPERSQLNERNAFQHALWHALMAQALGFDAAMRIGKAHERDQSEGSVDMHRDLINNERGALIGSALPAGTSAGIISEIIRDAVTKGLLACLDGSPVNGSIAAC